MTLDLGSVRADDFDPHVGSGFTATAPGADDFELTLMEVSRGGAGSAREQFTLTYAGGPNPPVQQGIMHLEHGTLGGLDLFLVPIGPGGDGRHRYEAVFA